MTKKMPQCPQILSLLRVESGNETNNNPPIPLVPEAYPKTREELTMSTLLLPPCL